MRSNAVLTRRQQAWIRGLLVVASTPMVTLILSMAGVTGQAAAIAIVVSIIAAAWIGGPLPGLITPIAMFLVVRLHTRGLESLAAISAREAFNTFLLSTLGGGLGWVAISRRNAFAMLRQHSVLLEQQAAELRSRNEELEEIAYAAAHDLREPLRAVAGYCQLLEAEFGQSLNEAARNYIHRSVDGTMRMHALLEGLLAFSGLQGEEAGFKPVNCQTALDEALANLDPAIRISGATILSDSLPTVRGKKPQLVSVFQNLIGNSIKYRSEQIPEIRLCANCRGGEWVISIQDNGIGIPIHLRSQLFRIFKRLHRRDDYPGAGLGLALCRRIIERHGGSIWIEGPDAGGTTFLFTLPVDRAMNIDGNGRQPGCPR